MNDFAKKLRQIRKAASLTQREMAERIGVPMRNYQNYEAGRFYPKSTAVYGRISAEFGVTVEELLAGEKASSDAALSARLQVTEVLDAVSGLFTGAALSEEDKDQVMKAISDAYWAAKLKGKDTDK